MSVLPKTLCFACGMALVLMAWAVVRMGERPGASTEPRQTPARITASTPLFAVERHFGHPSFTRVSGGSLTSLYVSRRHQWTIVLYVHPQPRPAE